MPRLVAPWSIGCSVPGTDSPGRSRIRFQTTRRRTSHGYRLDAADQHGHGLTYPDARTGRQEFSLHRSGIPLITVHFGLLIRGFGVRVPGGAPVIKALTWWFFPDQSHFHVHCGRLCARGVLWSRWTKPALDRRDGTGRTQSCQRVERGLGPGCSGSALGLVTIGLGDHLSSHRGLPRGGVGGSSEWAIWAPG